MLCLWLSPSGYPCGQKWINGIISISDQKIFFYIFYFNFHLFLKPLLPIVWSFRSKSKHCKLEKPTIECVFFAKKIFSHFCFCLFCLRKHKKLTSNKISEIFNGDNWSKASQNIQIRFHANDSPRDFHANDSPRDLFI